MNLNKYENNVFCITIKLDSMEAVLLFSSSIFMWYMYKYQDRIVKGTKLQEKPDNTKQQNLKKEKNPEEDYAKEMVLFNKLFSLKQADDKDDKRNINIHPDLYRDKNNHDEDWCKVENAWKSRILFHTTVQGNVIMYYDIYKLAFVYYSDMQVSYKWLNYCAMKYVRLFYCRDFFVDDTFLPAGFVNPFNQNKIDGEKKELEKKEKKRGLMSIDFKSDVFLTKKKKDVASLKVVAAPVTVVPEKFANNFRYMGKLNNYSFLQIPEKQEKICENYQYIDFKLKQEKKKALENESSNKQKHASSLYGWI